MSRRRFLAAAATATAAATVAGRSWAASPTPPPGGPDARPSRRPPNLILLVADDQRADSLGCAGNPVLRTPHIDALAAAGTRFTNSFATTAICMSSRASLLTGLYTSTHGIDNFQKPLPRPLFDRSYPMLLRAAGYHIGFIGKWGLGGALPIADYDFFDGFSGQGFYFEPGKPRHLTVRQADSAVAFLHTAPRDRPFCLAVSFKAPHVQDEGRGLPGMYPKYPYDRALESLYANASIPPPLTVDATAMPAFFDATLNRIREAPDFHPDNYQAAMKDLYRLIAGIDEAVGRIVAAVREIGVGDNTVILYTADHGSFYGEHGFGGKWLGLEESIRTPMILFDPRQRLVRRQCDQTVLNIDVAPTLLDLAGIASPPAMQGRSMVPLTWAVWRGMPAPPHPEWFYEHPFGEHHTVPIAPSQGIRTDRWKYLRYYESDPLYEQLFDLRSDPREQRNLASDPAQRPVLEHLRSRWRDWRTALARASSTQRWLDPAQPLRPLEKGVDRQLPVG